MQESFLKLSSWCEKEGYKGYDPYDGLNSKLFQSLPLLSKNRIARLAWIQLFRRSPLNLRPIAMIKKDYNPKALGLFLSGFCNLYSIDQDDSYLAKIKFFSDRLIELRSNNWSGACWGYNFDWQARAFFQPRYTPTVVATTFIGCAFLDAYDLTGEHRYLEIARSACDYILSDLNRTFDDNGNFAFSYSPLDKSVVFNASLLGSRLLSRVYSHTGESELRDEARRSVRFCCDHQKDDGSWSYGLQHFHHWIDNFHTGYNLECISDYKKYTDDHSFGMNFEKGLQYYVNTFFTEDGIPKYYNNSIYPVDIHSTAQLIVTLCKTGNFDRYRELADRVTGWTIDNMQSQKGYFFFRVNKYFSSRIPYMRWAQAWMFYALGMYLFQLMPSEVLTEKL